MVDSIHKYINIDKKAKTITYASNTYKVQGKNLLDILVSMKTEIDSAKAKNNSMIKQMAVLEEQNRQLKEFMELWQGFQNVYNSKNTEVVCCTKFDQGKCYPVNKRLQEIIEAIEKGFKDLNGCNWHTYTNINECQNCSFNNSDDDEDETECIINLALWHLCKVKRILKIKDKRGQKEC